MDEVTQKNAFTAEESARAARALDAQAKMLRGVVADLNALFNAQHSTTVAEPVLSVPNGRNINSFERLNGAMAQTGGAPVVGKQGRLG